MKVKLTQIINCETLILNTFNHKEFVPSTGGMISQFGIKAAKDKNGNFVLNESNEIIAFNTAPRNGIAKLNDIFYDYEIVGYLND